MTKSRYRQHPLRYSTLFILLFFASVMTRSAAPADAQVPCTGKPCRTMLHAGPTVKRFEVKGLVGEGWLLYLNIYDGGERLDYHRLAGGCDASYASTEVSAVLHACGNRASMEYVALLGHHALRVEYSYVRR